MTRSGFGAGAAIAAFACFATSPAAAQPAPPCSPYVQPLPPGYGAPYHAPKPCAPQLALQPSYAPQVYAQQYPPPPAQHQQQQHQQPAPARPDDDDDDDDEGDAISVFWELLALRVGSYDIRGSDADTRSWGFLVVLDPDVAATADYVSYRTSFYGALGGGSDGFEGHLTWRPRAGVRGYLGDDHGPFARIGLGLEFLGNNKLYRSWVELPYLEVGYQLMNDDVWFELGPTGGLVLGGRYYTGDAAERRIDTEPELGAQVTLQVDGFRAHASAMRIFAGQTGPGTPIDEVNAELCINPAGLFLMCGHAAYHRGDVELPGGGYSTSIATYFGGTIGLGVVRTGSRGLFD
jgi:hypothetical protein